MKAYFMEKINYTQFTSQVSRTFSTFPTQIKYLAVVNKATNGWLKSIIIFGPNSKSKHENISSCSKSYNDRSSLLIG